MTSQFIRYALLSLAGAVVIACSSQPPRDLANLPGKDACFWTRDLYDWTVLDDSTLIVRAPLPKDTYLIKLFAPIPGLKFHERLGFEGGDGAPGQICSFNAYVIAGGPGPERQPVVAVRALTPIEAKKLLSSPGAPAPRRPAPSDQGAPTG